MVVGINNIPAGEIDTPVTYNVPEGDRIKVQRGDAIGWSSYEVSVLTYDSMPDSDGSNLVRWIRGNQLSLNDTITFDGDASLEYSLEATVQVSIKVDMFPKSQI